MPLSVAADPTLIAQQFHALSDPTRIEILELLREGERCVCELTDALDMAQSRLSFHLKVLREAGIVSDRREGRWMYYALQTDTLASLESYLTNIQRVRPHGRGFSARAAACCS